MCAAKSGARRVLTPIDIIKDLGWVFGVILIGCALLESIELVELLIWRRSVESAPIRRAAGRPFVSFHVPTCSEPPDVVANTLLALRKLDYDSFEVLVVDNNTRDERLWKPIEGYCRELGDRFRFFHLPEWPGFKAGALNFALGETAPEATLISVVDADYEIAPNYLNEVLAHFDDARVAFVQTPQDYRDWALNAFSRICNWEYWQVFAVSMALRDRRNAILMHGTMNLVRRDAIERAGGWAEWCLTEDSELGLRLHAHGCRSSYVAETYGRGLVPFTFRVYKRQRRRWVIGGAQQLKRHFALFLPWPGGANQLTTVQKLYYLQGWLPWFRCSVVVLSAPIALAGGFAMLSGLAGPEALTWLSAGMTLVVAQLLLRQAAIYRHHLRLCWSDTVGATLANFSLVWAVGCGWLSGLSAAEQVFERTAKRPPEAAHWLDAARAELVVGAATFALALALTVASGPAGWLAVCGLTSYAILFLPAAWMARLSSSTRFVGGLRQSENAS